MGITRHIDDVPVSAVPIYSRLLFFPIGRNSLLQILECLRIISKKATPADLLILYFNFIASAMMEETNH